MAASNSAEAVPQQPVHPQRHRTCEKEAPMPRNMRDLSRQVAIIGVAESDQIGRVPDKTDVQLHVEAAWNAMEDAGVKKSEIDAVFTAGWGTLQMAEYLGITPRYTDSTSVGGSSFVIHLGHAAMDDER